MKIKTSELSGATLNWTVAELEGKNVTIMRDSDGKLFPQPVWADGIWQQDYERSWALAGPIIERECIAISALPDGLCRAYAPGGTQWVPHGELGLEVFKWTHKQEGYTPLIAAMRCYVASKLGDEVDVPEELMK